MSTVVAIARFAACSSFVAGQLSEADVCCGFASIRRMTSAGFPVTIDGSEVDSRRSQLLVATRL